MSDRYGSIPIGPAPTGLSPKSRSPRKSRSPKNGVDSTTTRTPSPESSPKPSPTRRQRPQRKIPTVLIVVLTVILIFCGYLAAGFWGVPKYIRSSLATEFQQQTGMRISFDQVRFNPLSFILDLSGISVDEVGLTSPGQPQDAVLSISSFSSELVPLQLLRGELVTTRLAIDNLDLHLIRNTDGKYNISPISQGNTINSQEEILDFSDLPFRFSLNNISIRHSRIIFEDKPKNGKHRIDDIELTLPNLSNFSFAANEYIHPSFRAVINGSPIEMTGQAVLSGDDSSEMQTNLECNFDDIDLPLYLGYLPITLPFDIQKGRADATFNLTFSPTAKEKKLLVEFSIQAEDTFIASKDNNFKIEIPSSKLEGDIQPITGDTHLDKIILRQPELRLKDTVGLEEAIAVLGSAVSTNDQDPYQALPNHQLAIDLLLADSGSLVRIDTNNKPLPGSWTGIQASLKNYTSTAARSADSKPSFRLVAEKSDKKGSLTWQGKLNHDNLPEGELQLAGVDVPWMFNMLGLADIGANRGTANIIAHVNYARGPSPDNTPVFTIEGASFTLSDFSAAQGKDIWYSSPETTVTGFSKIGNTISLGAVSTNKASLDLTIGKLPALFNDLARSDGSASVESLDFKGSIVLKSAKGNQPPLQVKEAELKAIRLARKDDQEARDNITFTGQLHGTGQIQGKGLVQLQPFSAEFTTEFSGIQSDSILPWFGSSRFTEGIAATINGNGQFSLPETQFAGSLKLDRGNLSGPDSKYLSWDSMSFQALRYTASPFKLYATELFINSPQLALTQSYGDQHPLARLHSYLRSEIVKPLYERAGTNTGALKIDRIKIDDGTMSYADTRLSPVWKATLTGLNGQIERINSAETIKPSPFSVTGNLDDVSFTQEGAITLFSSTMNGDSTISVTNIPLPAFHEQLSNQLDVDSSRGLVNVTETTEWAKGAMTQRSELLFQDVEPLSEIAESALTLALISDEENKFTITAENSQPDSSKPLDLYTDAVFSMKKMIVKAAVSPLLLASENFSDLVGNEFADFLPGEIILSGKGRESISRFSNLLASHPYIGITVTGIADPVVDGNELKEALEEIEEKRVAEENRKRSEQLNKETEEYLRKAAEARIAAGDTGQVVEEDLPVHLFSRYAPIEPEPVIIDDSMLLQLADQRAEVIATFFVEKLALDADRIRVNNHSVISQNEVSPGNRVQFSIEPYSQQKSRQ